MAFLSARSDAGSASPGLVLLAFGGSVRAAGGNCSLLSNRLSLLVGFAVHEESFIALFGIEHPLPLLQLASNDF